MDNMALPKGLLIRSNGFYFQARIPKKYLSHFPLSRIYEKLNVENLTDAIRLVYQKWAQLHQEFALIDSTGSRTKVTISLVEMENIVEAMVHSKVAEDGAMRSRRYHSDPNYKDRALRKLANDQYSVKEAISKGNYEGIQDSALRWLKGYGFELPDNSSELRTFFELYSEGLHKVNTLIEERDKGNPISEPKRPTPLTVSSESEKAIKEETLESLMDYWLTQSVKSRTAKAEAITIIKKFKSMVGDINPRDITRRHIIQLKDKMLEAGSAPATINKGRGILAAIFSTAEKNSKLENNAFIGMEKLKVPTSEVHKPYNLEELQIIFNSGIYINGERPKRFNGESVYWIPILALYSGARLNELGQIFVEDVGIEDGVHFYMIKHDPSTGRTVKNGKSRRVPIHPDLIKIGFLDYVAEIKSKSHIQLFPELKITRAEGKLADKWGDWWCNYVREDLKIKRIPQPTHGFRHTFIAHCRRCKVDSEHRRIIEGHTPNSVEFKAYGDALFPLEPLYEELNKLNFKGLDLSQLFQL